MDDFNPYEAPQAEGLASYVSLGGESATWRDGDMLVMTKEAVLPDTCFRCNLPAHGYRLKRKLYWHPPLWYALVLINLFLYALVAMLVRHTAQIEVGLCSKHRTARRRAIAVGWLLALIGIGGIALGVTSSPGSNLIWALPAGAVLFLIGLIYGSTRARIVTTKQIDKRFVRLAKVNPAYLAQFPAW